MDAKKLSAVTDWPHTGMVKELQRFLKSANFYRRFIKNYSMIAVPITSLLKDTPKKTKMELPSRRSLPETKRGIQILSNPPTS